MNEDEVSQLAIRVVLHIIQATQSLKAAQSIFRVAPDVLNVENSFNFNALIDDFLEKSNKIIIAELTQRANENPLVAEYLKQFNILPPEGN